MKLRESDYFDGGKLISYNCPISLCTGVRSLGKTYYFKRKGLLDYIKRGTTWAYIRRYDEQIKEQLKERGGFFSDMIVNGVAPEWEYRVNGRIMECRPAGSKERFKPFGQFIALSKYDARKGSIDAKMDKMVMDEFIRENRRSPYLPDEVAALMNLWETYDRRENRIRLYLLGNTADLTNPYFLEWGITITDPMPEFTRWHRNTVVLQYTAGNDAFRKRADDSNIGRVTRGTAYDAMAAKNRFLQYSEAFVVQAKPPKCRHTVTFKFQGETYSVWMDPARGDYYILAKDVQDGKQTIALTRDDMRPNMIMLAKSSPVLKTLARMYRYGYCFFDSVKTRERFLMMLHLMGVL